MQRPLSLSPIAENIPGRKGRVRPVRCIRPEEGCPEGGGVGSRGGRGIVILDMGRRTGRRRRRRRRHVEESKVGGRSAWDEPVGADSSRGRVAIGGVYQAVNVAWVGWQSFKRE